MATPGERVRALRDAAGLSRESLSDSTGISHGHLQKIESGGRELTHNAAISLAAPLGVTALYLMSGHNDYCDVCQRSALDGPIVTAEEAEEIMEVGDAVV